MDFQRLLIPKVPRTVQEDTNKRESAYWKSFKSPIFVKSYAPITDISFSQSAPHRYVVTSGTRLQVYSPKTNRVVKTISRFKETARSGALRADGKLCIAGDDSGLVQVFDVNSRAILRSFKAHKQSVILFRTDILDYEGLTLKRPRPVHVAQFSSGAGTQVLTASQDKTVRLFDLSTSEPIRTFQGHTDYVRAATFVATSPSLVFSGAYDGTVRLWDARVSEGTGEVWSGMHGKPVESVLVGETGTLAVSAGGPIMRVWDLLAASTSRTVDQETDTSGTEHCVRATSNHQKSITALSWAETEDGEKRVLSGGLDGMVKVYDPQQNWRVRHTVRYGGQVLSLAVSPNSSHLVVGLADGSLSIRTRVPSKRAVQLANEPVSYEAMLRAANSQGIVLTGKEARDGLAAFEDEVKIGRKKKKRLNPWDRFLKDFRYGDALDTVLKPDVIVPIKMAMLEELERRDGLRNAVANRNDVTLAPLLECLSNEIANPRYCSLVCRVAELVIDVYEPVLGLSALTDEMLLKLARKVDAEVKFDDELIRVRGALDMVFAASRRDY